MQTNHSFEVSEPMQKKSHKHDLGMITVFFSANVNLVGATVDRSLIKGNVLLLVKYSYCISVWNKRNPLIRIFRCVYLTSVISALNRLNGTVKIGMRTIIE